MTKNQSLALVSIFNGTIWASAFKLFMPASSSLPAAIFLGTTALTFAALYAITYRPNDPSDNDGPPL